MNEFRKLLTGKLSPARQSVLKHTTISEKSPGSLLSDINTLIDAIGTGMQTTSAYFALPQRVLGELNNLLVDPLPHDLKRPQLRSFPALMGLFMLLRSAGLAVGETKPKRRILIDPAMNEQWQALNPTEQYFTLMVLWLHETSWDSVGQGSRWGVGMLSDVRTAYLQLCDRITSLDNGHFGMLYGIEASVAVSLLHQFGWIRLTYDTVPEPGKAASIREIERTDFGDAMFVATCQFGSDDDESIMALQATLQNYFPDWKETLVQSEAEYREGQHTFKVSLGKIWRRIVASPDTNCEQLADTILDAYKFNHDHLYQFELRDSAGNTIKIGGPHLDEADYFAEEMRVGDVPLLIGDSMIFHYDFGDDWRFKVTLESVDATNTKKTKSLDVTATSGTALKQYGREDW